MIFKYKAYLLLAFFCFGLTFMFGQISFEKAFEDIDFDLPVEMVNANDGSDRIFIVEQLGKVRVFPNQSSVQDSDVSVFLDISSRISLSVGQEIGLLGMAFHPNFTSNGYVYVYYTDDVNGLINMNLARFTVDSNNPNQIDPSTELEIFQYIKNIDKGNHNGGKIAFGPDGYLYISIGDGGGGSDETGNGQNLNTVFASILRLDVDIDGSNPIENNPELPNGRYEIPSTNPRVNKSGLDEIYAWGFRNTWKFSFDNVNNRMWGGDVGEGRREEINIIENGGNYGWSRFEGLTTFKANEDLVTTPDIKPVFEYPHSAGDKSITGGYVYRGPINNPLISNKYIYGDYISGRVWALDYDSATGNATSEFLFTTNDQKVASFGLDEAQNLYFLDYGFDVHIYKLTGDSTGPSNVAVNGVGNWLTTGFEGTDGVIQTIHNDGSDTYYVGGQFSTVENVSANNLAVYSIVNGWQALGSGTNGTVNAITSDSQGNIYVGGSFSQINGLSASNIAVWNGSTWSVLRGGTSGTISKLGVDSQDNLYAVGIFVSADGVTANNIAVWNGTEWNNLQDANSNGIGTNNGIRSLAFDENDNIYVGGNFSTAGGNSALRIATWNGSNWGALGEGTSGFVESILVLPDYIYAGGNFDIAGSINANRIARFNRNSNVWEALDNGVSGNVSALSYDGNFIYAGGSFETVPDDSPDVFNIMNNIARWNSTNGWEALGKGTSVGVSVGINALATSSDNNTILAGGNFTNAGTITANNIAAWQISDRCQNDFITPELSVNDNTVNQTTVNLTEGNSFGISIQENYDFQIKLPDGSINSGVFNLPSVDESDSGTYEIITTQGCTLQIIVNVESPVVCNAFSITPEYVINGVVNNGANELTIEEGDSFILRIKQSIGFTITKPDNSIVTGELNFGAVNLTQAGTYTFTTTDGCQEEFVLNINASPVCNNFSITPEYFIDGELSSGLNELTLNEGTTFILRIKQTTAFTITLPDNSIITGSYDFGNLQISDSGTYTFETDEGCTEDFVLSVESASTCNALSITPEYTINTNTDSGLNEIEITEGETLVLGIVQSTSFSITLLDNTSVTGPYNFGQVTQSQSGTYIITTIDGCTENFVITVIPLVSCSSTSITPEYVINGEASFGLNQLSLDQGTTFELGITQNNDFTITLPDDSTVTGLYAFGPLELSDSGTYTIIDSNGCVEDFILEVLEIQTCNKFSITPEYLINNQLFSGQNELTLIEGTTFSLRIRQGNSFIIRFPDGSEVSGEYDFGRLRTDNQGTYTIVTDEGCSEDFNLIILPDSDLDGVTDAQDLCDSTSDGESVDSNGCSQSQLDDDNDGIVNSVDECENTPFGEAVNQLGCSDSQLDDDDDGVSNADDQCANTPSGELVDLNGCSASQLDDDNDGIVNSNDICPNTPADASVDNLGCSDSQQDIDNDGVSNADDLCNDTPAGATVDVNGCSDSQQDLDNDGILNAEDLCPNTPNGETVNTNGCSQSQLDDDNDGLPNSEDFCNNTPTGEVIDPNGCSQSQLDNDNDGVSNDIDICPNTPSNEVADVSGCSSSQLDDDSDGINNNVDTCPNTPENESVDATGCSSSQLDDDNDGVSNLIDECPNTPEGVIVDNTGCEVLPDNDNDGVPDIDDLCPNTPPNSIVDVDGCLLVTVPADNFTISATSATCRNLIDGIINISADLDLNYVANLTSESISESANFTDNLIFDELTPGSYELCIRIEGISTYESCSTIQISEPEELSVFSTVDEFNQSVSLQMSGGSEYFISLNKTNFKTTSNKITLNLPKELNSLKISTGQECQGVFEELISINHKTQFYPNPFDDSITINTSNIVQPSFEVVVFTLLGQEVLRQTIFVENRREVKLPLDLLSQGIYTLQLKRANSLQIFKLVKR